MIMSLNFADFFLSLNSSFSSALIMKDKLRVCNESEPHTFMHVPVQESSQIVFFFCENGQCFVASIH